SPDSLEHHRRDDGARRPPHFPRGRARRHAHEDDAMDRPLGHLRSRRHARGDRGSVAYIPEQPMRTAIVTGGSRGIGRAISLELAAAGRRVVITFEKDARSAEETVAEIRRRGGEAIACAADLRDAAAVKAVGERVSADFGGTDILVNNAGIIKDALFPFLKEEDWDAVMDIDLKGAFRMTKAVVRGMLHKNWGRIVNIV